MATDRLGHEYGVGGGDRNYAADPLEDRAVIVERVPIDEALRREQRAHRAEHALTLADGYERHCANMDGIVARPGDVVIRAEVYLAFLNAAAGDAS
jgi:hypothetical protein